VNRSRRDPFGERTASLGRKRLPVLDSTVIFESESRALLKLAEDAFAGLASRPEKSGGRARFRIRLALAARSKKPGMRAPALRDGAPRLASGAGWLCGGIDVDNQAIIDPGGRRALVLVSPRLLADPRFARYEMVEFAALTLVARARALVPLHAACVGRGDAGILLLGASGSGKSTLCDASCRAGMSFLSEDAVFVEQRSLRAWGLSNYLHLLPETRRFPGVRAARRLRAEPLIRRRSGVRKHEIDLRKYGATRARSLRLRAAVILERGRGAIPRLRPVSSARVRATLHAEQAYAAGRPEWRGFVARVAKLPAYELRRGATPDAAVALLGELLRPARRARRSNKRRHQQ